MESGEQRAIEVEALGRLRLLPQDGWLRHVARSQARRLEGRTSRRRRVHRRLSDSDDSLPSASVSSGTPRSACATGTPSATGSWRASSAACGPNSASPPNPITRCRTRERGRERRCVAVDALTEWLREQSNDTDRGSTAWTSVEFGHSAEMLALTVVTGGADAETRRDVILRLRPPPPALLEPYDLARQFTHPARHWRQQPVRVPPALWLRADWRCTGAPVLRDGSRGRHRLRIAGARRAPASGSVRMCESIAEQLAAIHLVDLTRRRVESNSTTAQAHLDRELDHWADEITGCNGARCLRSIDY